MILQALVQHYENLAGQDKVSKPGWCHAKVSYLIDLKEDNSKVPALARMCGS